MKTVFFKNRIVVILLLANIAIIASIYYMLSDNQTSRSGENAVSNIYKNMIVVDQIGYRTEGSKIFMIKNPQEGYDAEVEYIPGTGVQLRRSSDDLVVKNISLAKWNGGRVDKIFSGDLVWQGEFTTITTPGIYHIYDPKNSVGSYDFEIGKNIYQPVLVASVKSYFYQRSNIEIGEKHGGEWTHSLDHSQQKRAHLFDHSLGGDQGDSTARDVTGGWFDAGDYGKYTAYMGTIVWDLSYAFEWYPRGFNDNTNIPESGNGVPDILDEIKVELDWLLKMQRGDGALYSGCFPIKDKMGNNIDGDPSIDDSPYAYANISTAATSSGATSFAIGGRIFSQYQKNYPGYSDKLREGAESAWSFLDRNPKNIRYDSSGLMKGSYVHEDDADLRLRVLAASELFRLTGKEEYRAYFERNYNNPDTASGEHQPILSSRFDTDHSLDIQRGLVSYCFAPGANPVIVEEIKTALRNGIEQVVLKNRNDCPYKAYINPYHYHWGSNKVHATWANIIQYGIVLEVAPERADTYWEAAEDHLHYFNGRNATGYSYLTQSQLWGADKPITQIYHGWFHDGTKYDDNPAPGFLSGGPNRYFKPGRSNIKLVPPQDQPPMKAYRDWNTSWPENSWAVTENSTGYQAKHVLLTAAFVGMSK